MRTGLKWLVTLTIGVAVGIWIGVNEFTPGQQLLLYLGFIIVLIVLFIAPNGYTLYVSKNMKRVELFLARHRTKSPIYALMHAAANGDFDELERQIPLIRSQQTRISALISLHLERREIAQARSHLDGIRSASSRHYFEALIAILEKDGDRADKLKAGIRSQTLRHVVDAEIAYQRGQLEEADRAADLALASARGLQKYLHIKSLERQKNNPARHTYF